MFRRKIGAGVSLALAAGTLSLLPLSAANAATTDPNGASVGVNDVVTVGSDTTYLSVLAVANTYNATATGAKLFSFDPQLPGYNGSELVQLRPGIYAKRSDINGSGDGEANLKNTIKYYDAGGVELAGAALTTALAGAPYVVDSARSSSKRSSDLYHYAFAYDAIAIAVAKNSYAPATITKEQLVQIYTGQVTNWSQIGGGNAPIKVLAPQADSGTAKDFFKDLTGSEQPSNLVASLTRVQEHDPAAIVNDPTAIAPFSYGRAAINKDKVSVLGGYKFERAVYNLVRKADYDSTPARAVKFDSLYGQSGVFCNPNYADEIAAGGLYQLKFENCGIKATSPSPVLTHDVGPGEPAFHAGYAAPAPVDARPKAKTTVVHTVGVVSSKVKVKYLFQVVAKKKGKFASGTVSVYEKGKLIGKATLKKGKATFSLKKKLKKGTHKLTFKYVSKSSLVRSYDKPVTLRIKK